MKREILFRAKRLDDGKWLEGYYAEFKQLPNSCIYYIYKNHTLVDDVDPSTVCQYTGLTDKNGKRIFEGDIIKRTDLHILTEEPSIGFIEYDTDNTSFLIHWTDVVNYSATFTWKDRIEVIGNTFDNPELIEK